MTLQSCITALKVISYAFLLCSAVAGAVPKLAVLAPDGTDESREFAAEVSQHFGSIITVVDSDLAAAAYEAQRPVSPFNMTRDEAKLLGRSIGCDFFVVVRAANQRRSSSTRTEYYEAYAPIFLVSSRTGRLMYWDLKKFEEGKPHIAWKALIRSAAELGETIASRARTTSENELKEPAPPAMEEPPDEGSPLARNFKAPVPFRRIKPEYTGLAATYDVTATIEITVDLDAEGKVVRTEIAHWAGFGLDESVDRAVRAMNWRPAERNGKFIPMRFLLRYNFKKLPKE